MKQLNLTSILPSVLLACLAATGIGCSSTANKTQVTVSPADSLFNTLEKIYTRNATMLGHHDDPVYGHTWCADSGRSDILEVVGDYPAMMSWDLGGIELGNTENLDGVSFARMAEEVRNQHERGGFNTFSWHLFSPVDSTDCWNIGDSLTVTKIISDKKVNETFRSQLRTLANFFNSLKDENGNKIPVIFRPFHEHTGGWFWWGKYYATPEQYTGLWEITSEEFKKAGVDNVLFAYSTDRIKTEEEYLEYYPGDNFVDILGVDIYLFKGDDAGEQYKETVSAALPIITRLSKERGKLPAFTETGSEGIPMPEWWTEVLLPLLEKNPVSYVVLWRNAHDKPGHFYVPYPTHDSANSFKTFCNDHSILLINDLK